LQVWIRAKYEARRMVRRDLIAAELPAVLCAAAREDPQPPVAAGAAAEAGAAGVASAAGAAGGAGAFTAPPGGLARLLGVLCQVGWPYP
jgi:hypothetical protein